MRIVDREEFLTLPVGTVYSKIPTRGDEMVYDFGTPEIKGESSAHNDWYVQRIIGDFIGADDTIEWTDAFDEMREGISRFVDYNIQGRDGLFDENQLFAVFDKCDVRALIARLNKALEGVE